MASDQLYVHGRWCEHHAIKLREANAIGNRQGTRIGRIRADRRQLRETDVEARRLNLLIQDQMEHHRDEVPHDIRLYLQALDDLFQPMPLTDASPEALARRRERLQRHRDAILATR